LKKEGRLELVEPSEEMCTSYLQKAGDCLKSARILQENDLYENSVTMSYYAMYNSLTALLFRVGMKCENHTGSIIVFRKVFGRQDLYKAISFAKEERIDKQYYVDLALTKESAKDLFTKAEDFLVHLKIMIGNMRSDDVQEVRSKFNRIV
jgi:uncharacterized protein (UPF0332 family)